MQTRRGVLSGFAAVALGTIALAAGPVGIVGSDDRSIVADAAGSELYATVRVTSTFPDDSTVVGSGGLVAPSVVATAAHLVHDAARGGAATNIVVENIDGASFTSPVVRMVDTWRNTQDSAFDLAALDFDELVGRVEARYGISRFGSFTGRSVTSAGFASDLGADAPLAASTGAIAAVAGGVARLTATIDADATQTGGPLFVGSDPDDPSLLGVLTGGTEGANEGVVFDDVRFAYMSAWVGGYDRPSELVARSVTTTFGPCATYGDRGIVTAEIENVSARPSEFDLRLFFDADEGPSEFLGEGSYEIAGESTLTENIEIRVPPLPQARGGQFRIVIEGRRSADDLDVTQNEATSAELHLPAVLDALSRRGNARPKLGPGEQASYELTVPEGARRLRFRTTTPNMLIRYVGPDGTSGNLNGSDLRNSVDRPAAGVWRIVIENLGKKRRRIPLKTKIR